MKLGVFTCLLGNLPFEEALAYFASMGIRTVEIGTGGYPGKAHADPDVLLNDEKKFSEFKALIEKYNLEISALSCHANPVHPTNRRPRILTKPFATRFCLRKNSAFETSTPSPVPRGLGGGQSAQLGNLPVGLTSIPRFWSGSGTRC
jgi:hypothetical protein